MDTAIFYVYAFLDPFKKGDYKYGDYQFEYEPFYVGKGCARRSREHFSPSSLKCTQNNFKNNKLKKILKEGIEPIILKVSCNIFETDAFDLEKKLIAVIGRRNLDNGPLTNLTDGGEGITGLIKTEIHRKRLSQASLGKKQTEEAKKKISESLIGKRGRNTGNKHSIETKKQISETKKGTLSWNATPVLQLSDGEVIKEWVSATAAAKKLGLSQGNIWSVINGARKRCGGFEWKLKEKKLK